MGGQASFTPTKISYKNLISLKNFVFHISVKIMELFSFSFLKVDNSHLW